MESNLFRQHAAAMGRKGGKSRSPAKRRAARQNLYRWRLQARSKRLCQVCQVAHLNKLNRSGVCRGCQRRPGAGRAARR